MAKKKTRSKFETEVLSILNKKNVLYKYEGKKIKYNQKPKTYLPDIILENGIVIELKGYFKTSDRVKHLLIKEQFPNLDIRFVFQRAENKLHSKNNTTYSDWCDKHGFKWADKVIPEEWLNGSFKSKK